MKKIKEIIGEVVDIRVEGLVDELIEYIGEIRGKVQYIPNEKVIREQAEILEEESMGIINGGNEVCLIIYKHYVKNGHYCEGEIRGSALTKVKTVEEKTIEIFRQMDCWTVDIPLVKRGQYTEYRIRDHNNEIIGRGKEKIMKLL